MAVARLELTPSIPIFARIEVSAAKIEEAKARINHIWLSPFSYLSDYSLPIFSFVFCDKLTESQLVHAAVQSLLDPALITDRSFFRWNFQA
jgi:hypothetical protein